MGQGISWKLSTTSFWCKSR